MAGTRKRWSDLGHRLALGASNLRGRLFSVFVQVTNRCNLRCPSCGFWRHPAPASEELTVAEYRRISRELGELGHCHVSLEGGEPLLREDIVDVVAAFSEHHLTSLFTNGSLVTRPIAERLFRAGLGRAGVSIDFPDRQEHDRRRGPGIWESAWQAVDLLREAAPRGSRQVDVATIWMKANQDSIDRLLDMSKAHRVGHVLTLISTQGDRRSAGGDELPEASSIEPALALWRRHRHLRVPLDYLRLAGSFVRRERMPRCRAGAQSLNLDHVGGVAACIDRIDEPVGNARHQPMKALWRALGEADLGRDCQDCWVLCRGYVQLLGKGGRLGAAWDVLSRV